MEHLKQAARKGARVTALEERPTLPRHLSIVLRALEDLAADRGPSGIPFSALATWSREVGLPVFWLVDRVREIEAAAAEGGDDGGRDKIEDAGNE